MSRYISFGELVQMVSDWIFEANSKESALVDVLHCGRGMP